MFLPDSHNIDSLLEETLIFLDPDGTGETRLEQILQYDWKALERVLSLPPDDGTRDPGARVALVHRIDRLRRLILPFASPEGPLAEKLLLLSRQSSNPYVSRGRSHTPAELNRTV